MNTISFNNDKCYLGELCVHNHEWEGTGQSLRSLATKNKCLECQRADAKKYHANNLDKCRESKAKYKLTDKYQETEAKYREANSDKLRENAARHRKANPEKYREASAKYAKANPEKVAQSQKAYRSSEKYEEARERWKEARSSDRELFPEYNRFSSFKTRTVNGESYTIEQVRVRFSEFNNCCAYCKSKRNLTIDHFIAINNNGLDSLRNIVPACLSCNSGKRTSDALEWYQKKKFYSQEQWDFILSVLMKDGENEFFKWLYVINPLIKKR